MGIQAIQRLETEFIEDEHAGAYEFATVALPTLGLLVAPELLDELIGTGEGNAEPVLDGADAQALRYVGLTDSGRAQE